MSYQINEIDNGHTYQVKKNDDTIYTVRYCGSGDGDPEFVSLWECDCPAGRYGRNCKHISMVANFIDSQDSQ